MTLQDKMKERLEAVGLPFKDIECYGQQIVVTAWSEDAARKWATLLGRFAKVRGVVKSADETKDTAAIFKANPGLVKNIFLHDVWRVFARI